METSGIKNYDGCLIPWQVALVSFQVSYIHLETRSVNKDLFADCLFILDTQTLKSKGYFLNSFSKLQCRCFSWSIFYVQMLATFARINTFV